MAGVLLAECSLPHHGPGPRRTIGRGSPPALRWAAAQAAPRPRIGAPAAPGAYRLRVGGPRPVALIASLPEQP